VTHGKPGQIGAGLARLQAVAAEHGVDLLFPPDEGEKHGLEPAADHAAVDIAVVLGGDGTVLRALTRFLGTGVPVVGVNFGRVGFLSSMGRRDLEAACALLPAHLSLYGLTVEPRTPLARWVSRGATAPPSDERYAEERVRVLSRKYGPARIRHDLRAKGISGDIVEAISSDGELERARAILGRKYREPATTPEERAKRARFLQGRGFSTEVIMRLMGRDAEPY